MAIKAECPLCHKKQAVKNKLCACGQDLDKAKRAKKVKYHIVYRVNGKQRQEVVGYSIEEARDADGKRRVQKRENRIFEMLPESKISFEELSKWYLNLVSVKKLASYDRISGYIDNFDQVYSKYIVSNITPVDLENYQQQRENEGRAMATIDMELRIVQTIVNKAFENDKVDGRVLKAFRKVKKKLKKGANAQERVLSIPEYRSL